MSGADYLSVRALTNPLLKFILVLDLIMLEILFWQDGFEPELDFPLVLEEEFCFLSIHVDNDQAIVLFVTIFFVYMPYQIYQLATRVALYSIDCKL